MSRDPLTRLHDYQSEVLEILQRVEVMLNDACDVTNLARARWALLRALGGYQIFKHKDVFDPFIARASPVEACRLLRMKEACLALGDAFREHVRKWSGSDVDAQWAVYRPAALAMTKRIRVHIARERTEMEALLTKAA